MKAKITIVVAILCSLYSFGQTVGSIFPSGGLYFKITSASTVEVSEGNQNFVGVANIPSTAVDAGITYVVTSIGIHAFKQSTTLTSVIIPNSVTSIQSEAFVSCLSLNSVTIGNSVTSIGDRAFQYCSGLNAVIIGSSVTNIGSGAFHGGVNLKSITIPNSVTNIGQEAFYFCSVLTAVSMGNSIMSIGDGTFENCVKLTSINIPSSVVSMGYGAFRNCSGLTSVTVNWTTPLTINTTVFEGFNLGTKTLNIPVGTETAYKNALVWKDFGSILEPAIAPVLAQTFAASGINYIVTKATMPYEVAVGDNKSFVGAAAIPATVSNAGNSFEVKSIGVSAFENCLTLTSVIISNSVTSIASRAFADCPSLTAVNIPNSVTSIGDFAFGGCRNLMSVTIPNSVSSIGNKVFFSSGLTSFVIPSSVISIGESAFSYCESLNSITIPNTVTTIGDSAFAGCRRLTSVNIPNSVNSIGNLVFYDCTQLASVIIPSSVTSISSQAFQGCYGLTSVYIPNSVTSISEGAFSLCLGLTSVTIPISVTSIGKYAFYSCTGLVAVTVNWTAPLNITADVFSSINLATITLKVPAGTESDYENALVWKNFAPIVCIPTDNTTTISACGSYTWANNGQTYTTSGIYTGLTANCVTEKLDLTITAPPTIFRSEGINYVVTSPTTVAVSLNSGAAGAIAIPASVTTACGTYSVTHIGDSAFYNCTNLTSVTIPNSVTSTGNAAFRGCSGLTSFIIPDTLSSIGNNTFKDCTGLTSIDIPNSVTSIGIRAFSNCTGLTSITIPSSVTSINDGTFSSCSGLTSITIPNTIINIDASAFDSCIGLTSVTIPNSVTSIGSSAFYRCIGLTSVTVNWTAPLNIVANVFSLVNLSTIKLYVPAGTETTYKSALVWKDFGTVATLATNNFSLNNKVKFYPNPTTSYITFSQEIAKLDVFDIAGKKVKSFQKTNATYDVSNLEKGVYILKGKTEEGKSINEKLTKN